MTDTLVRVENVSKKFCRSLRRSLWYGMQDLGSELLGRRHGGDGSLRPDEFWAVRDVSLTLRRGECLGLIGHNGAGKTTLLRMLNGLIKPDAGRIEIRGRVGALIALGAGFNPVLTGRENVYVNAAVLGLRKPEIDSRFAQIVEFAGLGEFIDSPVQHYSSGMYVRLGFSIAAHVQPDILLVDEALAVGDIAFIVRCLNKVAELRRNGTGVIFVSHNELQMREAAGRCLFLAHGSTQFDGEVDQALAHYELSRADAAGQDAGLLYVHEGPVRMVGCRVWTAPPGPLPAPGEPVTLLIDYESAAARQGANVELRFWNTRGQVVTSINSRGQGFPIDLVPGPGTLRVEIPALPLVPGRYRLAGGFRRDGEVLGWSSTLASVEVAASPGMNTGDGLCITPASFSIDGVTRDSDRT